MGIGADAKKYRIHTLAGPITPVLNDDETITVDMGEPILEASLVPTTLKANGDDGKSVVDQHLVCNGKEWKVSTVSMGNPHAVIFVNDLEKDLEFESDGPSLACGTGACALVVAAIRAGKIPRPSPENNKGVRVTLPGGDLFIEWRKSNNKVYMTGPANLSFKGPAALK